MDWWFYGERNGLVVDSGLLLLGACLRLLAVIETSCTESEMDWWLVQVYRRHRDLLYGERNGLVVGAGLRLLAVIETSSTESEMDWWLVQVYVS